MISNHFGVVYVGVMSPFWTQNRRRSTSQLLCPGCTFMATTTSADTPRDALEKVDDFGMVWIVDFNVGCWLVLGPPLRTIFGSTLGWNYLSTRYWIKLDQLISMDFQLISIDFNLLSIYFPIDFQLISIYFQLISIDVQLISIDFNLFSIDFNWF